MVSGIGERRLNVGPKSDYFGLSGVTQLRGFFGLLVASCARLGKGVNGLIALATSTAPLFAFSGKIIRVKYFKYQDQDRS